MTVEIFTLCDAATVEAGKLNILGSFDTLSAARFPTRHPSCVVVCKLRRHENDAEEPLDMRIIDPDGHDVIPPASMTLPQGPGVHHHLWHINGFPLATPGTFYIDLLVAGELIARNPLFVRLKDEVEP